MSVAPPGRGVPLRETSPLSRVSDALNSCCLREPEPSPTVDLPFECGVLRLVLGVTAPHKIQDVSTDLLDLFQLSAAQCIGRTMGVLSGPQTNTQAFAELMQLVATGKRARAVLMLYSCSGAGERFCVSAQPWFSACGELTSALLELEPCKTLTLKTAALDDGRAKAIVEASQPFRATFCSPEFEALYGLAEPMVLGRTLNLIHGPTTDQGAWRRLLAAAVEGAQGSAQLVTATCDCREIEVMVEVQPIVSAAGCITHLLVAFMRPAIGSAYPGQQIDKLQGGEWQMQAVEATHADAPQRSFDELGFEHVESADIDFAEEDGQCSLARVLGGTTGAKACGKCDEGICPSSDLAGSSRQCGSACATCMVESEEEDSTRRRDIRTSGSFRRVPSSCSVSVQGSTWQGGLIIALLILALPGLLRSCAARTPAILASSGHPVTSPASVDLAISPRLLPSQPHPQPRLRHQQDTGDKLTLMLDLDKTALYGNDGNDLGIALQWMDKDFSKVQELYKRLINPSLRKAYDFYVQQGKQVQVVIYTRRPQIVYYKSCVRHNTLPVRYAEDWHDDQGQIHFPPHVQTSEDILATYAGPELEEDEVHDVKMSLDRLLAARNAVAHELGLSAAPPVVVTAEAKKTEATAQHLNMPVESCLLFDDNVELRDDRHVVLVEPLESLPADRREQLLEFMQRELPAERLEEDLIEYLEEAKPNEMSIKRDVNGKLTWWVAETTGKVPGWRTPDISPSRGASCQLLQLKPGADSLRWHVKDVHEESDHGSNVSPSNESVSPSNEARNVPLRTAGQGLVDLRAAVERAAFMRNLALAKG
eukprot:Tamp_05929.p1 GENE.Tamp_05929~~Tamp_05929.p1  ORF type:complete len:833 (-),score=200.19 Tamp_05929:344-2806(-)